MAKFNIIYKSRLGDHFLSDGITMNKIGSKERITLLYSGKSIKSDEINATIAETKKLVARQFPDDSVPNVKAVEITTS